MFTLLLWTHALAALLFGALALWAVRPREGNFPRLPLAFALAMTALWALSVAGIGATETATRISEAARNLAWLGFMILLHRRDGNARPPLALGTVYGVVAVVAMIALGLHTFANSESGELAERVNIAAVLLRMLVAVAALVLVQALYNAVAPGSGQGLRWIMIALAGMWFLDFNVLAIVYLSVETPQWLFVMRGLGVIAVAMMMIAGFQRKGEWNVQVSRVVAWQSLSLVAIGTYFAVVALATSAIATVGGENVRVLQTAFVFGSTAAILTLASSPWLRAWAKVKLAKHLFRHRYDYRAEWIRFTGTLGAPEGAAPLDERMIKAIADLTDSPAGLLLVPEGAGLGVGTAWHWDGPTGVAAPALAQHLAATGRILELDPLRGSDGVEAALVPQWMLDAPEAWALVPLPHLGSLAGAILLARPALARPLDWEDFDLLKVAGRQVASYLAEARAQEALADARRFDEFNRRFAFILHDIKNLVSQLTLTARNAQRHADNPEFRADMVATLQSSAEKMTALLARLSQHGVARSEPLRTVEIVPLVERVAAARRSQHPVLVSGARDALAIADPAGLEQLLGHLVQNAIEASDPAEPVTLAVGVEGANVIIDVIDQGCGMSPAFIRDRLFKPFDSSKPGGFGIGAFEARQLAQGMEATLEVSSRVGQGSRFRLTLRAAHAGDAALGRAA